MKGKLSMSQHSNYQHDDKKATVKWDSRYGTYRKNIPLALAKKHMGDDAPIVMNRKMRRHAKRTTQTQQENTVLSEEQLSEVARHLSEPRLDLDTPAERRVTEEAELTKNGVKLSESTDQNPETK